MIRNQVLGVTYTPMTPVSKNAGAGGIMSVRLAWTT